MPSGEISKGFRESMLIKLTSKTLCTIKMVLNVTKICCVAIFKAFKKMLEIDNCPNVIAGVTLLKFTI